MFYHGFSPKSGGGKYWTTYDDQLITTLFSKIITKTAGTPPGDEGVSLTEDIVNNLFDICFYINKDYHDC